MKYAIMSDIHANPLALKAALEDARRLECGKFVMLGDITGYGYDVAPTIEMVRANFDVILLGNHDQVCAGEGDELEMRYNPNYRLDLRQRRQLDAAQLDWIKTLPFTHEEGEIAFSHGDFTNPPRWNYVCELAEAEANFAACNARLMFCGHSHSACVFARAAEGPAEPLLADRLACVPLHSQTVLLKFEPAKRYLVNVGSVGHPRNDLCSTYAVYDTEKDLLALRRLPFDFRDYVEKMVAKKIQLPDWLMAQIMRYAQNPV